ncbi:MAG: CAP domain-containing protein [Desulfomonile sp.]|nr:CAP domain-containing protein [Desulfomonile sp.]
MIEHLEAKVVHYTNEARKLNGLPILEGSAPLKAVARNHSTNMCRTRTFLHESPVFPKGWDTFISRLKHVGVRSGGENIGYRTITSDGDEWARQMVEGWMKGAAHRKNILNAQFRYLGVGVSRCDNDLCYATQIFSSERGRAPIHD